MTAPADFTTDETGRIEIKLGSQLAGIIEPWDGPQFRTGAERVRGLGRIHAYFWITLPIDGGTDSKHPATSPKAARWLVLKALSQWFENAGPLCHAQAQALALQAELERDALQAPALFRAVHR